MLKNGLLLAEIEHQQRVLEQNKQRVQKDFETWFAKASPAELAGKTPLAESSRENQSPPSRPASAKSNSVPFAPTGNAQADRDIAAFYQMRDNLLSNRK